MEHGELITTLKAQAWEEAKGKLRAVVAIGGSVSSGGPDPGNHRDKWPKLNADVERFIAEVENDGLHE